MAVKRNKRCGDILSFLVAGVLSWGLAQLILRQTYLAGLGIAIAVFVVVSIIKPHLGFIIWFVISPTSYGHTLDVGRGIPMIGFDRFTLFLLFTVVTAQKAVARRKGAPMRLDVVDGLLVVFAAVAIFSALFPAQVDITVPRGLRTYAAKQETTSALQQLLDHYLLAFVAFFVARSLLDDERRIWGMAVAMSLIPFYMGPIAIFENITGRSLWSRTGMAISEAYAGKGRAMGPFPSPPLLGMAVGTCWVFTLFLFYRLQKRGTKVPMLVSMGLAATAALLTYTRGAWLAVVGQLLVFAVASRRARKAILVPFALLSVVTVLSWAALSQTTVFKERVLRKETVESRVIAEVSVINMIKERPWFGFGAGRYAKHRHLYFQRLPGIRLSRTGEGVSHNTFLATIADVGLIGFLPYILIFVVMAFRSAVAYRLLPDSKAVISRDLVGAAAAAVVGYVLGAVTFDTRLFAYCEYMLWTSFAILFICHKRALEQLSAQKAAEPERSLGAAAIPSHAA